MSDELRDTDLLGELETNAATIRGIGFPWTADLLLAARFHINRDAAHIASLEKALDYLRGENRRLTGLLTETADFLERPRREPK